MRWLIIFAITSAVVPARADPGRDYCEDRTNTPPPQIADAPPSQTCSGFTGYEEAVAYCVARYATTWWCGGRDGDCDGLPCECLPDAPSFDEKACASRDEEGLGER